MKGPRPASLNPTVPERTVLAGRALALLVTLAPAAFAGTPVRPAAGQPTQARPQETGSATGEWQLVLPPPVAARLALAQRSLAPAGLRKLERLARTLAPRIASQADPAALQNEAVQGVNTVFSAAGLSSIDVSEAAFLVMAMATKDMDDDLRLIMAEVKATTAAKQKLRDQIKELEGWITQEMAGHGQTSTDLEKAGTGATRGVMPGTVSIQATPSSRRALKLEKATSPLLRWEYTRAPVIAPLPPRDATVSVKSLRSLQVELSGTLDGMNELLAAMSSRLNVTMDWRAKLIGTLSRIMKKNTTTMESLVQNLK
ncbi:MAG: hypothetical protein V1750_00180 [Acidobacteriota bacterium]